MFRNQVEVVKGLWLGNEFASRDEDFLEAADITSILNLCGSKELSARRTVGRLKVIPMRDTSNVSARERQKLIQDVREGSDFISRSLSRGENILVHCEMGMNRSAFMVAAYLILHHGEHSHRAIRLVEEANMSRGQRKTLTNDLFRTVLSTSLQ